ncbi:hypothetical protein SAMN04488518_103168 [Pseudovibrio ascidiaceicola]|uniref:Uncharacterized protein n=1 Tax=Pseudovibrio ascidiaceicola TaxID=285279 RepID=A0A1I3XUK4_9HYPH|nr:hypothetical protein PsWM33_03858 [Pseudovibrio sp. WM33]SFK23337.1 hypothetical protein SAMN04488518_103168 [Pseudovibrio ascidiaceicola]
MACPRQKRNQNGPLLFCRNVQSDLTAEPFRPVSFAYGVGDFAIDCEKCAGNQSVKCFSQVIHIHYLGYLPIGMIR